MISQKDQDYIELLSPALDADINRDVEAHHDVEVDNNVEVDNDVTVDNNVEVGNDVGVDSNAIVANSLTVGGDLQVNGNIKYKQAVIPAYPTAEGTYVLKLTVDASGHATFAWIAA
jgi:predicted acyltransferase (DUF342 family)